MSKCSPKAHVGLKMGPDRFFVDFGLHYWPYLGVQIRQKVDVFLIYFSGSLCLWFWTRFGCILDVVLVGVPFFSNMWIYWFLIPLPCNLYGFRGSEACKINQKSFKKHDRAPISILSWMLVDLWSFWHPFWLPTSIQNLCSNLIDFRRPFGIVFVLFWIHGPHVYQGPAFSKIFVLSRIISFCLFLSSSSNFIILIWVWLNKYIAFYSW